MRRVWVIGLSIALVLLAGLAQPPALAQGPEGEQRATQSLAIFTEFPAQVAEVGENVRFDLTLRNSTPSPQTVRLDMGELPDGWTATFRGGGNIVQAVYVEPESRASVDLRLEPPSGISGGTYRFTVLARGDGVEAELPLELTLKEREELPARLALNVELPTLRGTPNSSFTYDATLRNEGDEDLTVTLEADTPDGFLVTFETAVGRKEVTSLPINAGASERLSINVETFRRVSAGSYPITVRAVGGEAEAEQTLTAEITGQPELSVTGPNGRLSGEVSAGSQTPLTVIVQNTGSAAAHSVEMSASPPSNWSVDFEPQEIPEIPPGQQVQVTANVQPADQAIAGDYMVTVRAQPQGGRSQSSEFRITVLTSTLWGVVGIGVIAVAVLVVGLAVMRFGRR